MNTTPWEEELRESICTVAQLKKYIELAPKEERQLQEIIEKYPMRITKYYMSLIDVNNPDDPIRKMAIPSEEELNLSGSYDTSGERENTKMPGLQHKYAQTALVLATNRCETYCRHCFRKRLVGRPTEEILHQFDSAARYIEKHEEINNVIVSGGDSFVLPTKVIAKFLDKFSHLSHIDFIRFGTRAPVTFPGRILKDDELLKVLKSYSLPSRRIYIVTQFNHPREITKESIAAVNKLIESNVIVENQSVLLKGVNDDPNVLSALQNKLVGIGVIPYYVFQCRPVKRVKNKFQVSLRRGYEIIESAKRACSGHSKRFKYVMSHRTGKIEILGILEDCIYLKYHQAKAPGNIGKIFIRRISESAGWLDDLEVEPCGVCY